eukprot:gene9051-11087_t
MMEHLISQKVLPLETSNWCMKEVFLKKCSFGKKSVQFFGHIVGPNTIKPMQIHSFGQKNEIKPLTKSRLKDDDGKNFELSTNYTTLEKEHFVVFQALKTYRYILLGSDIVVRTDHKNLLFIKNSLLKSTNPRISRLLQEISNYNPKISYIEGQYNYISDGLSRFTFLVKTSGQLNPNIIEAIKDSYKILELGKLPEHFHNARFDKISGLRIQNELIVVPDDPIPCQFVSMKHTKWVITQLIPLWKWSIILFQVSCKEGNYHPYKPFGLTEPLPVPNFCFEVISIHKLLADEFHDHMYSIGYKPNERFTTEFVKEYSINSIPYK